MLNWESTADTMFYQDIFDAALRNAIAIAIADIEPEPEAPSGALAAVADDDGLSDDERLCFPSFAHTFPRVSGIFTSSEAERHWQELAAANRDAVVYELDDDYYFLLLYEALCVFYDEENLPVVGARVMDLGDLEYVERFFPDLDFVDDAILTASSAVLEQAGIREQTLAVLKKRKPSPGEMRLLPVRRVS